MLCLIERKTGEAGTFQFEVQSLREYFAARHIFENVPTRGRGPSRDRCLTALLQRPYWSNVARFFVGMFSAVEVRGIKHNLLELMKEQDLAHHPIPRSIAALFLNDRTYEGQNDAPIREIVDFILSGPGVVFAEDGLLDVSGSSLLLSERAGRSQAVLHLKERLGHETDPTKRRLIAQCLRRHANNQDDLAAWWWSQYHLDVQWLTTAADLGALTRLTPSQADKLTQLATAVTSDVIWLTELLDRGGYDGNANGILAAVVIEVGDGAVDILSPHAENRPIDQILRLAKVARAQTGSTPNGGIETTPSRQRVRAQRRSRDDRLLRQVQSIAAQLHASSDEASPQKSCPNSFELSLRTMG